MHFLELEEGRLSAAAVRVVAVAWDGDPLDVGAVVATEPNQTELEETDEQNQTKHEGAAVTVAVVGASEGGLTGVALGVLGEAVRAAVMT